MAQSQRCTCQTWCRHNANACELALPGRETTSDFQTLSLSLLFSSLLFSSLLFSSLARPLCVRVRVRVLVRVRVRVCVHVRVIVNQNQIAHQCGVITTFSMFSNGLSARGGSFSSTSSPAPAISPAHRPGEPARERPKEEAKGSGREGRQTHRSREQPLVLPRPALHRDKYLQRSHLLNK